MTARLRSWLLAVLALDALGLGCVLVTWFLAGGGEGGLGPYLQAVGNAAVTPTRLLLYCAGIALYSAGLELVLRRALQGPLAGWLVRRASARAAPWLAGAAAAAAYALTHMIYHPAGVAYAAVLGAGTAATFAWLRDWRPLALWHVQWNALAIAGTLFLALWGPGDARDAVLFAYKADRIERGTLVHAPGWGWVDRTHLPHEQLDEALAWAGGRPGDRLHLDAELTHILGGRVPIARTYRLQAPAADDHHAWALSCAVVLDFHVHHEQAQAGQPWWTGTPLSAFQFDDLPSVLRACMDRRPGAEALAIETDLVALRARWAREGLEKVRTPVREVAVPEAVAEATAAWVAER